MPQALIKIVRHIEPDTDSDPEDKLFNSGSFEGDQEDEHRLQLYRRGAWHYVGVMAKAEIRIPYGEDFILAEITSPGLWDIESDSSDEYFDSVFKEEKKTLLTMLESLMDYRVED